MAKILVIDDEPDIRPAMRAALEAAGHSVDEAENGMVGMARFRADPADVVITDLIMPEQEGIETIVALRRAYPGLRIIAITGAGDAEILLKVARQVGACRTLAKPFTAEELRAAVVEALAANSEPRA